MRKTPWTALLLAAALLLQGCATLNQLGSDVWTYSQWPQGRKPGTYAFERLPSQQAHREQQQLLEDAARGALEAAGFRPVPQGQASEFIVQLGARVSANERSPFDDPFWWHGGLYRYWGPGGWYGRPYWPHGAYWGPGFGPRWESQTFEREAALLIRDRSSGQAVYEARASHTGYTPSMRGLLPALFSAALLDFPDGGPNPRRVTVPLSP